MHSILKCISDHSETDPPPLSCLFTSFLGLCVCFLGHEHPFGRWSLQMTATSDQLPPPCPPGHMVTLFFPLGMALHPFGSFLVSPGSTLVLLSSYSTLSQEVSSIPLTSLVPQCPRAWCMSWQGLQRPLVLLYPD